MAEQAVTKIGIISDTHDHFDPQVREIFQGVDHILHAGDIGLPWIIMELEDIAPVTAVTGNTDNGIEFKDTELVQIGARRFLIHHVVEPKELTDKLRRKKGR